MREILKKTLSVAIIVTLLCTQYVVGFAATETITSSLVYSNYSFDGESYGNFGSGNLATKTGTEIGVFDNALLGNQWILDHTNSTANGLGKGFSSTNAVEIPNDAVTFDSFTASAWFACAHIDGRSNAGTVQRILSNGGYGDTSGWYVSVLVQSNGNTYIGVNIGGASGHTEFIDVTSSKGVYLNYGWHNIVLVADRASNKAYLYLDGEVLVNFDTMDSWYNDAATSAYIGGYKAGDNVVEGFCGFISDVQSINRAMSATQVEAYCGAGSADSKTLLADQFDDEIATLLGNSVTLDGNIGVNYYMGLSDDIATNSDLFMRFTLADGSKQDVTECTYHESRNAYVFTCELPAKHMTDVVKAQLFVGDEAKTDEYEFSVREYANVLLADTSQGTNIKTLVTNMLHYGAYSQQYFNYKTDDLANAGLDALDLSDITQATFAQYATNSITEAEGFGSIVASNLYLKSEICLKVYIQPADGVNAEDYIFKCGETTLEQGTYGDWISITVPNIAADELDKNFIITAVSKTNEEVKYEFKYGVFTYAYKALDNNYSGRTGLKDLMKVMYKYNEATAALNE